MLCPICEKVEIFSTDENADRCVICWFTGRYMESVLSSPQRAELLTRLRDLDNVVEAVVWHNGDGLFTLAMILTDSRLVLAGTPAVIEDTGTVIFGPAIPPAGYQWIVSVVRPLEEQNEWSGEPTIIPETVDDEGLVQLIKEIA